MRPKYFKNNRPLIEMNELPAWAYSSRELLEIEFQTEKIIDNVRYVYDIELEKILAEEKQDELIRNQMSKLGIM